LSLSRLVRLLGNDLTAVIFSDDPVTKMHDSLPMVLFRFEIPVKLYQAREMDWFAHFFPWVLINEGMSHKQVDTYDRVGWFQMAYTYLMKFMATYESSQTESGVKPFGMKNDGPKVWRLLFDRTLVTHATNAIAGIVYEIKKATKPISLQRASTVRVEKKLEKTRMHAGVHQTVVELVKTMEADEALQFIYVQEQIKNRRLAYGETVFPCSCLTGIEITLLIFVQAIIHIVEFPAVISPLLGHLQLAEFHQFAEKLMPNGRGLWEATVKIENGRSDGGS
jgi:hypothetical protein